MSVRRNKGRCEACKEKQIPRSGFRSEGLQWRTFLDVYRRVRVRMRVCFGCYTIPPAGLKGLY